MCECGHSIEEHRAHKGIQVADPLSLTKDYMLKITEYLSCCKVEGCNCHFYARSEPQTSLVLTERSGSSPDSGRPPRKNQIDNLDGQ